MADIFCNRACRSKAKRRSGVWATLWRMAECYRQRRALARLEAHHLRDIGLTQEQAEAESRRPIWDAPSYWNR